MKKSKLLIVLVVLIALFMSSGDMKKSVEAETSGPLDFEDESDLTGALLEHLFLPLVMVPENSTAEAIGPSGGIFPAFIVDQLNPGTMYVGTWGTGIYKSVDIGLTWQEINQGLNNLKIQSLGIDPQNSQILYAGTYGGGVFKSINGGQSWIVSSGEVIGNHIIYDIEIDPRVPQNIFTVSRISGSLVGYIHKSEDYGITWQLMMKGDRFDTDDYFYDIDINPLNSTQIFLAAHEHGFFRSDDGGISWNAINNGVTDLSARSLAIDPVTPSNLFGGVWHGVGVFKSSNSGNNWYTANSGFPYDVEVYRVIIDPSSDPLSRKVYTCTYEDGLYRSDNGAANWNYAGLDGRFIYDFGISQITTRKIFASTYLGGLFSSIDDGNIWQSSDKGIFNTNITGLASSTAYPGKLFAAVYGKGIYKSENKGTTWVEVNSGITNREINSLFILDGNFYALSSMSVFFSNDGENWGELPGPSVQMQQSNILLPFNMTTYDLPEEILLIESDHDEYPSKISSSNSPLVSITKVNESLIGGTPGYGAWIYANGIWQQLGLDSRWIYSIAYDGLLNRIIASSCLYQFSDGQISDCKVSKAENQSGGWVWSDFNEGLPGVKANILLIRGDDYSAATNDGIFIRDNNGSQWVRVGLTGIRVLSITADSVNSCKLYAGTASGAYYSSDCGLTWQEGPSNLGGLNLQTVWVDLHDTNIVYFGTNQAGAYKWDK